MFAQACAAQAAFPMHYLHIKLFGPGARRSPRENDRPVACPVKFLDPGASRDPKKIFNPVPFPGTPRRGAGLGPTAGSQAIPLSARFAEDLVLDMYSLFTQWYHLFAELYSLGSRRDC